MDDADKVWNRATEVDLDEDAREGDRALHGALLFHGEAMSGGVLNGFEALEEDELEAARAGFEWLGMSEVASLLGRMADVIDATDLDDDEAADALESRLDRDYDALVPADRTLEDALRRRLTEDPDAFGPV
ncbi:DMP19 family protein [Knoellia sp. CPCC 206450]|uniref:DMP19 family protein n=1 Tax=Knoellia tibetensis TaxID=3404798 RepID=UPI003B43CF49